MLDRKEKLLPMVLIIFVLISLMPFPARADFSKLSVLNDISGKVAKPGDLV